MKLISTVAQTLIPDEPPRIRNVTPIMHPGDAPGHRGSLESNQRNSLFLFTGDSVQAIEPSHTDRDEFARRLIMV